MLNFKTIKIILLVVLLVISFAINWRSSIVYGDMKRATITVAEAEQTNDTISGWFWQLIDQISKMWKIDMLPYWMPLTQGNTQTFKYTVPDIENTFEYTIAIQGTEIVKGVEAVKAVVTESTFPVGDIIKGSYKAYMSDLSDGKIILKDYFGIEPGGYYELFAPFRNTGRYLSAIPGKKSSFNYAIGSYNGDNVLVDSGVQVVEVIFLGFEDVTVPAGAFKECLKTSVRFTNSFQKEYEGRTQAISVEDIIWEAKGVGVVKIKTNEISYIKQLDDDSILNTVFEGGISELSSATIDSVDYP